MYTYRLEGDAVILEPDVHAWAEWFIAAGDNLCIESTPIRNKYGRTVDVVETRFIGSAEDPKNPLVFTTQDRNGEGARSQTRAQALNYHKRLVRLVKARHGIKP